MSDKSRYAGIIPAFYACYDDDGAVSPAKVRELTRYLIGKGVNGLYVGGSSGECIYQSVEERKLVLENVMAEASGRVTVIAHVACNSTRNSQILAEHAQSVGVDAIAAIPPIYFKLPDHSIADYWNDISAAAPDTDFIIYNIPQLAGVELTIPLLREMKRNPRVIGVKHSAMAPYGISLFLNEGVLVFNGVDEQLAAGLMTGAVGGIGGTYGAMPELYIRLRQMVLDGKNQDACQLQAQICRVIEKMCAGKCHMYAMIKEVLRQQGAPDIGDARKPMTGLTEPDKAIAADCARMIEDAKKRWC